VEEYKFNILQETHQQMR